jgi:hypothetical protein
LKDNPGAGNVFSKQESNPRNVKPLPVLKLQASIGAVCDKQGKQIVNLYAIPGSNGCGIPYHSVVDNDMEGAYVLCMGAKTPFNNLIRNYEDKERDCVVFKNRPVKMASSSLSFREPVVGESVVYVGYQPDEVNGFPEYTVSASTVFNTEGDHTAVTKQAACGGLMIAEKDLKVVGIHRWGSGLTGGPNRCMVMNTELLGFYKAASDRGSPGHLNVVQS